MLSSPAPKKKPANLSLCTESASALTGRLASSELTEDVLMLIARFLEFTELLEGFTQTCTVWYSVSKRIRDLDGNDLHKLSGLLPRKLTSLRVSLPAPESDPYRPSSEVIEAISQLIDKLPHLRVLELFCRNKSGAIMFDNRAVNSFRARVSIDEMGTAADEACSKGLKHLLIHRCDLDVEFGYGLAGICPDLRTLCLTGGSPLCHPKFDVLPTDNLKCLTSLMLGGSVPSSFGFDAWIKHHLLDSGSACKLTYVEARGSDLDVTLETMFAVRRCRKDVRLDFSMMDLVTTLFSIVDNI